MAMRGDAMSMKRRCAVAGLYTALTVGATACDPARCEPPYPPVAATFDPPLPGQDWPVEGTVRPLGIAFDTDADGAEDTIEPADGSPVRKLTVHRGSGDLVLSGDPTISAGSAVILGPPISIGDSDGDGRSEVAVTTYDASGAASGFYLVPGSTPDGKHEPAEVGIRLLAGSPARSVAAGDVDGDGADDVVIGDGSGRSFVLSGRDVTAPGPGGAYDPLVAPPTQLFGNLVGAAALSPAVGAVFVVTGGAESMQITLWTNGGSLGFTTAGGAFDFPSPRVEVVDAADGNSWLVAREGRRSLRLQWAWDFDDLCAGQLATATAAE
jgi:hypothetical protein